MTERVEENDLILADQLWEATVAGDHAITSMAAANMLASLLLIGVMYGQVSGLALFIWFVVQTAFQAVRILAARRYRRNPLRRGAGLRMWARLQSYLAIGSGCIWGVAGILFYPPGSPVHQALLAILLCGLAAGSIVVNAILLPGLIGSVVAILGLFIVRLAWTGDLINWQIAVMLTVYLVLILIWGRDLNHVLVRSLRRRHKNKALITRLRKQTEKAVNAKRIAEEASIAKSKFLAAASHDLRQPMQALTLLSGVLVEEQRPDKLQVLTSQIARSVEALETLFNSILDISKLDAGVTEPTTSHFYLDSLFERLRSDFSQMASDKGLQLRIRKTNAILRTDPRLLERILLNLLVNAIRYTEAGGIVVGCRKRKDGWRIDVVDSGVGIPEDERKRIFDEFYQIGNTERDRTKGLGLGLAIVHRLSGLLSLRVSLRSRIGHGTAFLLTVPAGSDPVRNAAPMPITGYSFDSLRVLIVDDEPDARSALVLLLAGWGCDVIEAESLSQVQAAMKTSDWRPELAIVDLRLRREETGLEVLSWLHEHIDQKLPGIIITGDIVAERLRDVKKSGYTLLHKPVPPARLRSLMQFLSRKTMRPV